MNVNLLVELKYYKFIQEALNIVEEEIDRNFKDIPILLRKDNRNVFLVNAETLSDNNKTVKQLQLTA